MRLGSSIAPLIGRAGRYLSAAPGDIPFIERAQFSESADPGLKPGGEGSDVDDCLLPEIWLSLEVGAEHASKGAGRYPPLSR